MKTRFVLIVFLLIAGLSFAQPIRQPSGFAPPSTGGGGESEGTAVAADVLTGKTFSNDSETGISGTMPNNGAISITPGTSSQAIPAGYHNGSGSVAGDTDLNANNIASGTAVFGVAGTFSPLASVTGTLYRQVELGATGTAGDMFIVRGEINTIGQITKTANADSNPAGAANGVITSSDGQYLAVAVNVSPYLKTYKWSSSNNRYEATAAHDSNPPGAATSIAMSADGLYLAVASNVSPCLKTYKWSSSNNRYEATTAQDANPPRPAYGAAMSADGLYLAVASNVSPYLKTYKWSSSNNRYEATAAQDANPPGASYVPGMSADGQYLAVPSTASPYVKVYKWSSGSNRYEATTVPDSNPPGAAYGAAISADGSYLAVSSVTSPYLKTYKWSSGNNRYEATAAHDSNPPGAANGAAMSADGQYLAIAIGGTSPYFKTYKWSSTNSRYEVTAAPDISPGGTTYGATMSSGGEFMTFALGGSPYIATYRTNGSEKLSPAMPLIASAGYTLLPYNAAYIGALMESGVASDVVNFAAFWWRQDLLPPTE